MIRKALKKVSKNKKLQHFIKKYHISPEYLSTNRRMVSNAVFVGLFIAMIPMPMQMAAVIAMMPLLKFNVPIALAMCWLTNPFTMPPLYYIEYLTGSFFLGTKIGDVEISMDWFTNNIDNIFIPLYVGTAFYSVVVSVGGYLLVNYLWERSVRADRQKHRKHR